MGVEFETPAVEKTVSLGKFIGLEIDDGDTRMS